MVLIIMQRLTRHVSVIRLTNRGRLTADVIVAHTEHVDAVTGVTSLRRRAQADVLHGCLVSYDGMR